MKLLQHSWSDMLVLDHIHQHMHNNLANEIMLHNGQKFDLLALGLLGVTTMADCFARVVDRLQELKFDVGDYICLKFLLLLNPGKYNMRCLERTYKQSGFILFMCNVHLRRTTHLLFLFANKRLYLICDFLAISRRRERDWEQ